MQKCWLLHHPAVVEKCSRLEHIAFLHFTNHSLTQIEMIDIGHKSLPIIIGPYLRGYQSTTTNMLVLINYGYLEIDVKGVVQKIHWQLVVLDMLKVCRFSFIIMNITSTRVKKDHRLVKVVCEQPITYGTQLKIETLLYSERAKFSNSDNQTFPMLHFVSSLLNYWKGYSTHNIFEVVFYC